MFLRTREYIHRCHCINQTIHQLISNTCPTSTTPIQLPQTSQTPPPNFNTTPKMPLRHSDRPPTGLLQYLQEQTTRGRRALFVVLYASPVHSVGNLIKPEVEGEGGGEGESWCGDCREAAPVVKRVFEGWEDDVAVKFVGDKPEWRDLENVWRKEPWNITNLPTVLKVAPTAKANEIAITRLVEADVIDEAKLRDFIKKEYYPPLEKEEGDEGDKKKGKKCE